MATNLPREVYPNPEAGSSVLIDSNGYTNLVANGPSVPYAYVLNTEMADGIYKIVLLSNSPQTICGRWAGLIAGTSIKTFHIDPTGIDTGTVQYGSRGIKANGNWLYLNTSELQIPNFWSGPVELTLEVHVGSAGSSLYAAVNGNWLPRAVSGINQPVHFVFEVYDTLNLKIVSYQKLTAPSISTSVSYTLYDWGLPAPAPKIVARSFAPPPPPPVPIVTVNIQGGPITVDPEKVNIIGTWVVLNAGSTKQKTAVVKPATTKDGWLAKWGTNYVFEVASLTSLSVELWYNDTDGAPEKIGVGKVALSGKSGLVAVPINEEEDNEQVATINVGLTYGTK